MYDTPYDYASLLHFPEWVFAIDSSKPVIIPLYEACNGMGQNESKWNDSRQTREWLLSVFYCRLFGFNRDDLWRYHAVESHVQMQEELRNVG